MKKSQKKMKPTVILIFTSWLFLIFVGYVKAEDIFTQAHSALSVGVVGDTGIGERAYHPGFIAVAKALKNKNLDLLLHL